MATIIYCPRCREPHFTSGVICLGIEESCEGWVVLEYVCPTTGEINKAIELNVAVRGCATDEEYESVYGK